MLFQCGVQTNISQALKYEYRKNTKFNNLISIIYRITVILTVTPITYNKNYTVISNITYKYAFKVMANVSALIFYLLDFLFFKYYLFGIFA